MPSFKTLSSLPRAVRQRLRLRRIMRRLQPLLVSGTYRTRWNLAWRETGPDEKRPDAHAGFLDHNRRSRPASDPADLLLHTHTVLNPAADSAANAPACDVVVLRGDCTLLLSQDGQQVLRIFSSAERPNRILRNHEQLSATLHVPEVLRLQTDIPHCHGIAETLLVGTTLKHAAPDQVRAAYRDFLAQYAAHAGTAGPAALARASLDDLLGWGLPTWLRHALSERESAVRDLLEASPGLHAHGDCHPGNLIACASGRTGLIDLERAEPLPFFFDPLYLLRMDNPIGAMLRDEFITGALDEPLGAIWQAAGVEFRPDARLNYLLAAALVHILRTQYAQTPIQERADKLARSSRALQPLFAHR